MPETREDMHDGTAQQSPDKPRVGRKLKIAVAAIVAAALLIAGIAGAVLVDRALQAKSDLTGMTAPVYFASDTQTGRFTVNIEFSAPKSWGGEESGDAEDGGANGADPDATEERGEGGTEGDGRPDGGTQGEEPVDSDPTETACIEMTWDDAWFFGNSQNRNDQLEFACRAISAAAEAQSATGAGVEETAAFMEHVFASLGFTGAETVLDEDGAGYTVASKTIISESGEEKLVIATCVHGLAGRSEAAASSALGAGFEGIAAKTAHANLAESIADAVKRRIGVRSSSSVALLFCGQGVNGDVAQIAADATSGASSKDTQLAAATSIFVYASEAPDAKPARTEAPEGESAGTEQEATPLPSGLSNP